MQALWSAGHSISQDIHYKLYGAVFLNVVSLTYSLVASRGSANEPDVPSTTRPHLCLQDTPWSGQRHRAGEQKAATQSEFHIIIVHIFESDYSSMD